MPYFEKNTPNSNNKIIGIANKICDITSGGVKNIPSIKEKTIIYDLLFLNVSFLTILNFIIIFIKIGILKHIPLIKIIVNIKSK